MSILDEYFPRDEDFPAPREEPKRESPRKYGVRGENWTKGYMQKLCGILLQKRSDAPIVLPDGSEIPPKGVIDFYGSVLQRGGSVAWHVEVEVKTFQGAFPFSMISPEQAKKLTASACRKELAILSLCQRKGMEIVRMAWIPWPHLVNDEYAQLRLIDTSTCKTLAWVREELRKRSAGNYQGKSIREEDWDLLESFLVTRESGSWQLASGHWLRKVLCLTEEQPSLF